MRFKTKLILGLIAVLVVAGAVFGVKAYLDYSKQISGLEWFDMQEKYIDEMETYADNMDDVFALYLSGTISEEDFINHLTVLSNELKVMKAVYEEDKAKNPVRTGTHTYSSKTGCEAVEKNYDTFEKIIIMAASKENYSDVNILGYKYLAYQQEIIDNLADYMGAKDIIEESGDKNE